MNNEGRKNIPRAIAKQRGYYRPSKHKDQIADIKGLDWLEQDHIPEAPTDLTEEAKWLWNYQLTQSANVDGYISHIDLALFKEYCYVYGELEWLKTNISTNVITNSNGVRRVHPLYSEMQKLRKDFTTLGNVFGFSPLSRTKLKLTRLSRVEDPYADGI